MGAKHGLEQKELPNKLKTTERERGEKNNTEHQSKRAGALQRKRKKAGVSDFIEFTLSEL